MLLAGKGDAAGERVPRGWHVADGHRQVGEAEHRAEIPVWDRRCASSATSARWSVLTRPSARRSTTRRRLSSAPATFKRTPYKGLEFKARAYTIQVAPEDCTGCNLCVTVCPAKDRTNPRHKAIDMHPQPPLREPERDELRLLPRPAGDRDRPISPRSITRRRSFSSRCSSTRVRAPAAARRRTSSCSRSSSAIDCSSPTPPAAPRSTAATCRRRRTRTNKDGRGPAWSNSLFEDNAEFGLGMRLALDSHVSAARSLVTHLAPSLAGALVQRAARCRPVERCRHRRAARARSGSASRAVGCSARPRPPGSRRSPTTW